MFAFMRQTVCPQRRQTNAATQTDVPEPEAEVCYDHQQTPRRNVYETHSNVSDSVNSSSHSSNVHDARSNVFETTGGSARSNVYSLTNEPMPPPLCRICSGFHSVEECLERFLSQSEEEEDDEVDIRPAKFFSKKEHGGSLDWPEQEGLQRLPEVRAKIADLHGGALQVLTPGELNELRILKGRMVYRGDIVYEVRWSYRNVFAIPVRTREERLRRLSRRIRWRRVIHRVIVLLQQRQAWSVMGRRLRATASLFRHVRRTNGRLHYDFYGRIVRRRRGYH
jgi:hypothetical protein